MVTIPSGREFDRILHRTLTHGNLERIRNMNFAPILAIALLASGQTFVNNTEKKLSCEAGERNERERRRACDLREYRLAPSGRITLGTHNGGVDIKGWAASEVLVRARVEVYTPKDGLAPETYLPQIQVQASGGEIRTIEPSVKPENTWFTVSYEVFVPHQTNLDLKSHNGGVSVRDVKGAIRFDTHNGGVNLARVAGNVEGSTHNGGINVDLEGVRWDGNQLMLETNNGGVNVRVPENYSARVEMSTHNGGMKTDFPVTMTGDLKKTKEMGFNLGSGGALIRLRTHNGGVTLRKKT